MVTRREMRADKLMQALRQSDRLHLKEAAALLGVSEMTIRRDLHGQRAPLSLLGGYIVLTRSASPHYLLSDQQQRHVHEKRCAARLAAAIVEPHQTLFFDCGTTTPLVIEALDDALPFTGVCYSLNTFLALREKPACRVILCGGEFHANNAVFQPLSFQETLGNLCTDIAFLSAAGVHAQQGASCFNLNELPVKQWALKMAQRRVLVIDSSKFGQVRPVCMGPLASFNLLISNAAPPADIIQTARLSNVALRY